MAVAEHAVFGPQSSRGERVGDLTVERLQELVRQTAVRVCAAGRSCAHANTPVPVPAMHSPKTSTMLINKGTIILCMSYWPLYLFARPYKVPSQNCLSSIHHFQEGLPKYAHPAVSRSVGCLLTAQSLCACAAVFGDAGGSDCADGGHSCVQSQETPPPANRKSLTALWTTLGANDRLS